VLTSRLIDRPIRPLMPDGFYYETQIIVTVLSIDQTMASDVVGIVAASAALAVSDIPCAGHLASVRIGRVNGEFVVNPDRSALETSELNLVVAGTQDAVMMVEAGASGLSEDMMIDAIELAHAEIKKIIAKIQELQDKVGKAKRAFQAEALDAEVEKAVRSQAASAICEAMYIPGKADRQERFDQILQESIETVAGEDDERKAHVKRAFHELEYSEVRRMILEKKTRADGRGLAEVRPITCEVGLLPRTHGSALFTRGETQSLGVVTLGTGDDEQRIDALEGEYSRSFMLHYNFPPFSVGEAKFLRGPGRREVGHGKLAERALSAVLPTKEAFPYTIRIVSEVLESNGSSSMATICSGTLALMDSAAPIKAPVAGIAMGLILEGDQLAILSDISGMEDHLGDMDFKVAGTKDGVTALQMDIKIGGVTPTLMRQALAQARGGRMTILEKMNECLTTPRTELALYAPRISTIQIKQDRIRDIIGPGGKVIRGIIAECGVKMNVEDTGIVTIAAVDGASAQKAMDIVLGLVEEVEIGKIYLGTVRKIMDFGAFVEILPNTDGLVHISQLAPHRVQSVSDEVAEGEQILVKVLEIDRQGKIRLSRKEAMAEQAGEDQPSA
jgi:polyribonucleotide nucleotidyltransferase